MSVPCVSSQVFSIVHDLEGHVVGCGLYLQAAAANHSCIPNAAQSFDGRTLSLRCTRPIFKGQEITIGITEIHRPRATRRASLRESFFFECQCERCESQGADAEDAQLEGYACPNTACLGVCAMSGSGRAREMLQRGSSALPSLPEIGVCRYLFCSTCNASRPVEDADREGKAIYELLERGKVLASGMEWSAAKGCLEEALQRASPCLHRGNWVLSDIYAELPSVCLQLQVSKNYPAAS